MYGCFCYDIRVGKINFVDQLNKDAELKIRHRIFLVSNLRSSAKETKRII